MAVRIRRRLCGFGSGSDRHRILVFPRLCILFVMLSHHAPAAARVHRGV